MKIPLVGTIVPLLILVLWVPCRAQSRSGTIDLSRVATPPVRTEGAPVWWMSAPARGAVQIGRLHFGVVVANESEMPVTLSVSFQSYLGDGARHLGCHSPAMTVEIAPRERAFATCTLAIATRHAGDLHITSRLWNVRGVAWPPQEAEVLETGLLADKPRGEMNAYNAFARVRTRDPRDTRAKVFFRFYGDDGVQLATCLSDDVKIEPEVALRVQCAMPAFVDPSRPQPTRVRAELRPSIYGRPSDVRAVRDGRQ